MRWGRMRKEIDELLEYARVDIFVSDYILQYTESRGSNLQWFPLRSVDGRLGFGFCLARDTATMIRPHLYV